MPTTQRLSGPSIASLPSHLAFFGRRRILASRPRFPRPWALVSLAGQRRSSSAIDRTDTRGRRGRLFWSGVTADKGGADRHLPRRRALNTMLTIYEGEGLFWRTCTAGVA